MNTSISNATKASLNIRKINARTMHELRRRGHADKVIASMSPEFAFSEVCKYNGIMNPAKGSPAILDNLRQAAA